jgi:hypothetical protein
MKQKEKEYLPKGWLDYEWWNRKNIRWI